MRARAAAASSPAVAAPLRLVAPLCAALLAPIAGAAQQTHVLVVSGLGGDPEYTSRFVGWSTALLDAAEEAGVAGDRITWLAEREGLDARAAGVSRVEAIAGRIAALAGASSAGDVILIVLFGHGSARDGEARLNLPGPDLSAGQLEAMLAPLDDRRVVVVNAASASGGFVAPLARPNRVVITATRSPAEAEATRFGGFFVDALSGAGADADRDGAISILEAFDYARREVARSFERDGSLPTEHALIDDDGDGRGSLEPGGPDGDLAARITLAPATGAAAAGSELARLREERARLEAELQSLRARRDELGPDAYERELERVLLEIARVGRAIRELEGGGT